MKKIICLILCLIIVLSSIVFCFASGHSGYMTFCIVTPSVNIPPAYFSFSELFYLDGSFYSRPPYEFVAGNSYLMGFQGSFSSVDELKSYLTDRYYSPVLASLSSFSQLNTFYFSEEAPVIPEPTQPTFWEQVSQFFTFIRNSISSFLSIIFSNTYLTCLVLVPFIFIMIKILKYLLSTRL